MRMPERIMLLSLINSNTRLLIINLPSNPTGGTVPRTEIEKLVDGLAEHPHVCVLSDEIYSRILYDGREHVSLLEYQQLRDRLILLDGWSKTYAMTGWRLGYGVWPESLIEIATRLSINCHSCVNAATQYAGIAALEGPQDAVDEMTDAFDERRQVIVNELNQIPGFNCPEPGGAFYTFPNVTDIPMTCAEFADYLLTEAGVALLPGSSFGMFGDGYLRMSYASSIDNIQEALIRIDKAVSEV